MPQQPPRDASTGAALVTGPGSERCSRLMHLAGTALAWLSGWQVRGQVPTTEKMVIIAAPHTSNWDFVYLLMAASVLRLKIHWLGKHTLFKPPFGTIMRWLGGIAVDRSSSADLVSQLVDRFTQEQQLAIVIPPEGTRSLTDKWRSGFYWIAFRAQIPLVCGYLDYQKKEAGIGLAFIPSGNQAADMDQLRAFYQDKVPRYPLLAGPVRLLDEGPR